MMHHNKGDWYSDYIVTVYLFGVSDSIYKFKSMIHKDNLVTWCEKNIKITDYIWAPMTFQQLIFNFKHKEDAITFRLTFGGR